MATGKIKTYDFILTDLMRSAGISMMAHIAAGFGRKGNREFFPCLSISHRSLAEPQCRRYEGLELNDLNPADFEKMNLQPEEVPGMFTSLMTASQNQVSKTKNTPEHSTIKLTN